MINLVTTPAQITSDASHTVVSGGGTPLYTRICIKRSYLQIIDKWTCVPFLYSDHLLVAMVVMVVSGWSLVTRPGPGQHSRLLFRCILSPKLLRTLNQYGNQNIGSENTYLFPRPSQVLALAQKCNRMRNKTGEIVWYEMWASVREVEGNFIFTRIRAQVNAVQILITHKYFSGVGVNFQLGLTLATTQQWWCQVVMKEPAY